MAEGQEIRVVAIGHVPPPVTGQSLMFDIMTRARYSRVRIARVPMVLSREVASQGSFAAGKLLRLFPIPFRAVRARLATGAQILYYMPSGPVRWAVLRDMYVLLLTRPFFKRTVFHFHAGGLSEIYPKLSTPLRWLYRKALFHPDLIVRISPASPSELEHLQGRREVIVPNGIDDPAGEVPSQERGRSGPPNLLFVGHLLEGKGILVLLEAMALLKQAGRDVQLTCVGAWTSEATRVQAESMLEEYDLGAHVHFPGQLSGEAKWSCYRNADVFCFPSYFHSEVFPLVLLEAMAFALPIVTTRWRGIPDVVEEGVNALLVPTQNPEACARALAELLDDAGLRDRFGAASRARFLARFQAAAHTAAMESAFEAVSS